MTWQFVKNYDIGHGDKTLEYIIIEYIYLHTLTCLCIQKLYHATIITCD